MIICAGRNETFNFAQPMGVGFVESAINLTRQCLFDKPDYILFVGSAGSYGNYEPFDIVTSTSAANIELSFLRNDAFTPLENVLNAQNKLVKNETIVNSSNYISTNFELSQQFNNYNIGIENMEFYALLQVAKEFQVDIAGIFVITNYTNQTAHEDFLANHKKAMKTLTTYLLQQQIIK
jgi:nucleoside phosphorylase